MFLMRSIRRAPEHLRRLYAAGHGSGVARTRVVDAAVAERAPLVWSAAAPVKWDVLEDATRVAATHQRRVSFPRHGVGIA